MTGGPPAAGAVDLLLAAVDVALDRNKIAIAVLDGVLAVGAAFVLGLVAALTDRTAVALLLALVWIGVAWLIHSVCTGAIAWLSLRELSGHGRAGLAPALRFALEHGRTLALVPLFLIAVVAAALAAEWLLLHVARLPSVGEAARAVLFLPLVAVNVLAMVVVVLGLWLGPAVMAHDPRAPREAVRQIWRAVTVAPGRLLALFGATAGLALLGTASLGALVAVASSAVLTLGTWAVGGRAAPPVQPPLAGIDLASLAASRGSPLGDVLPALIYLLYWALIVAVTTAVPLGVYPVGAACAARLAMDVASEDARRPIA